MTRDHDPAQSAEQARQAATEAGIRAEELYEHLRDGAGKPRGSSPEQIADALRRAERADARAASSAHRAIEAKLSAAEAHDNAARLHERRAADGRAAEAPEHQRQAEYHRGAAARDRAAAQAELEELEDPR